MELKAVGQERAALGVRLAQLEKRERALERAIAAKENGRPITAEEIAADRERQIAAVHAQRAELEKRIKTAALSAGGITPELAREFRQAAEHSKGYEEMLRRAWEAGDKGYYARFEVRGRLEKVASPPHVDPASPFAHVPPHTAWRVVAGRDAFALRFEAGAGEAAEKAREGMVNKSVLISGRVPDRDGVLVQSIKVAED